MQTYEFFLLHPVFRVEEFAAFLAGRGSTHAATRQSLLAYHRRQGRIFRIRRAVYASLFPLATPETTSIDPYLLASRLSEDAIISYHSALQFHQDPSGEIKHLTFLTRHGLGRPFRFRERIYRPASHPAALLRADRDQTGVTTARHAGLEIRITSLERTLVDVLDRPNLAWSWSDLWRSLEAFERIDPRAAIEYALLLERATTAAKLGLFLEQNRIRFDVQEQELDRLRARIPSSPHYIDRNLGLTNRLVGDWKLMVPIEILNRPWRQDS